MTYRTAFNSVFSVESWIAAGVAAVIVGLLAFAIWRYRSRPGSDRKPSRRSEWPVVEASYTLAVLAAAIFLVWLSFTNLGKEQDADTRRPALVVKVTGFQWCWRFTYEHRGTTVQGTCDQGRTLPTLVVPTGEPVKFDITSNDVVHEFWLPYLDMKLEAFPNHVNHFTATFASAGRWEGHCSEFCGLYHADMLFFVRAESPAAYRSWLSAHHGFHLE